MNWDRRVVSGILGGLGVALATLMVYVFVADHLADWNRVAPDSVEAVDVAVFFPDRSEWRIFRRGLAECLSPARGLGRVLLEDDETVVVETLPNRRTVRFAWTNVRGETETKAEARRLSTGGRRPIAVVGSSNTLLTTALAERLRADLAEGRSDGPILLVPWATSRRILQTYPLRSFRFCSNNLCAAETLVDCLASRSATREPKRVVIAVDRHDPYSVDLGECFREVVARRFPSASVVVRTDVFESANHRPGSGVVASPSAAEQDLARGLWTASLSARDESTWLMLPVQNEPARRMLAALNGAAPGGSSSSGAGLVVVCGDAVGRTTLQSFVNLLTFPVWGLSTVSNLGEASGAGLGDDVQILGEVAAALLIALDDRGVGVPNDLRFALLRIRVRTADRSALGRPLAFLPSGERAWESDDDVLQVAPGRDRVAYCARDALGVWSDPRPIAVEDGGNR